MQDAHILLSVHCFLLWAFVCNRTFVQKSSFFGNTNILLSNPTKKSNAANNFSLRAIKKMTYDR